MKDDLDIRFEGGPYNGNSFNVDADMDIFEISAHSGSYSATHIYTRQGDKFVYGRTETHAHPE